MHIYSETNPEMPVDCMFLWREGRWHAQGKTASNYKAVPARIAKLLDAAKQSGRLHETAPGLYRLSAGPAAALFNASESPLQRMALLRQPDGTAVLDTDQVRAGEHLRQDYERAHLAARVTASYDASGAVGRKGGQASDNYIADLSDGTLAARQRVHRALDAVGAELSGILLHVCCLAAGLEQAELRLNLPRRAGKAVLQLALTRLARHYGYKRALQHEGPQRIGHWATPDFKPVIADADLASALIRATMEASPLERCGVR